MRKVSAAAIEQLRALVAALRLEGEESRRRLADDDRSPRVLERAGLLLRYPRLESETPFLFGQSRAVFVEQRPGQIAAFDVRPGSVVFEPTLDRSGVVVERRPGRLAVVFPEALDTGAPISLRVSHDEVTGTRLIKALGAAEALTGPSALLLEKLLGLAPLEPFAPRPVPLFDTALNPPQIAAVTLALSSHDVALVHGPFGTGKTRVLVEIVRQFAARGARVLCLSASNAAADHLALSLLDAEPTLALGRAGHPARAHPKLVDRTLAALTEKNERRVLARGLFKEAQQKRQREQKRTTRGPDPDRRARKQELDALYRDARRLERQAVDEVLAETRVLVGTLTGALNDLPDRERFDVLVVDEASQAQTPALLPGLMRVEKVVLAGDHRQLPPTVLSPAAHLLSATVFEQLAASAPGHVQLLEIQHRMHEALMFFPSGEFYEGRLQAHPAVAGIQLLDLGIVVPELAPGPLEVIDTAGAGLDEDVDPETESRKNPGHAERGVALVQALVAAGLLPSQIGVITPYGAQVALYLERLGALVERGLEVDSVDGFQGREKEVILFDAVRSNSAGQIGFLKDVRRLNVALSRARRKLIFLGDSATLCADPTYRAFFEHAQAFDAYRSVFELT